ncbi:DUF7471 family protein [Halorussus amylolyticus]|uniref:DUF7471 family protein n=1 Tax=Halorussus amylolyticus TaxID=1126242 RepID=UPI001EE426A3|nr:hypothetical protein [Halorussus amylolyticus]
MLFPDGRVLVGPAHAGTGPSAELVVLLGLAGVGSALVLALALAALFRRRTRSYLLVALALSTLLARTGVAALSAVGTVGAESHHVLEHGLDVVMAGLVIAAVYDARTARKDAALDDSRGEES